MSANPLVAGPVDTSTAFGGTGLLESVTDLCSTLQSGSWVSAGLAGVGVALDAAAAVIDPLGSLIGAGLGWLMEHLQPLKGWLDDLTGDADAVLGFARTWGNVATAMSAAGDELTRVVRADLEAMTGDSITAYTAYADGLADRIRVTGTSAGSIGSALQVCGMVVRAVHDLVRDTLAQLVGSIISWATEAVFTLGLATPVIVGQVSTRVSSLATRIGRSVSDVITSAKSLKGLLEALKDALTRLAHGVRTKLGGTRTPGEPTPHTPTGASYRPRPTSDLRAEEWGETVYEQLRNDDEFVGDLVRQNPHADPDDIAAAVRHAFVDEHILGGGPYGPEHLGRFQSGPDNAEAWLRLRDGSATDVDRLLLQHEIAEMKYMRAHPGATYREAHVHANGVANWEENL